MSAIGLQASLARHFQSGTDQRIGSITPIAAANHLTSWLATMLAGDGTGDIDRLIEALENDYPLGFIDGMWAPEADTE